MTRKRREIDLIEKTAPSETVLLVDGFRVFDPNSDTESPRRCDRVDFFGASKIGDGAADLKPNLLMAVSSSLSASSFTEQ